MALRILSYNIHKGFAAGNTEFVLSRMREAIRSVDADVVLLQEVVGANTQHAETLPHWPTQSQFEFLADSVWSHYAYGQNAVYEAGHHGNAILSKFPIESWEKIELPSNRFEHRGILHASLKDPSTGQRLHALCLHLGLWGWNRTAQIDTLCERVLSHVPPHEPLIIGGDFNDWRQKASRALVNRLGVLEAHRFLHGRYAKTFPAFLPALSLDRVYLKGLVPRDARALTGEAWKGLSDHAPILVTAEAAQI